MLFLVILHQVLIVVAQIFTLARAASETELRRHLIVDRTFNDVLLPRQNTTINPGDVTPSDIPSEVFFLLYAMLF